MSRILFAGFILLLFSCTSDPKPEKDNFIEAERFIPLLVDVHMVYAIQTSPEFRELSQIYDTIEFYSYIFEKHNITKAAFDSTLSYYSKHPEELMGIYDEVIMQLNQKMDSL